MEKEQYDRIEMEIITFINTDVIQTSEGKDNDDDFPYVV